MTNARLLLHRTNSHAALLAAFHNEGREFASAASQYVIDGASMALVDIIGRDNAAIVIYGIADKIATKGELPPIPLDKKPDIIDRNRLQITWFILGAITACAASMAAILLGVK